MVLDPNADAAARRLWPLIEAVHAVVYFAPEPQQAFADAGYKGYWMGYFAARTAPLGEVGPAAAQAACFNFSPVRAYRALPDAWQYAGAEVALAARLEGGVAALTRLLSAGAGHSGVDLTRAAHLAWTAAQHADVSGRILAAGNQALVRPEVPMGALWQACTTLREHRGDGHIAILMAEQVSPAQAHLIKVTNGESDETTLRSSRSFSADEWTAAAHGLRSRRWSDGASPTVAGRAAHARIERRTDTLAAQPWERLGAAGTDELEVLLRPIAAAAAASIPYPNPMGVPAPGS